MGNIAATILQAIGRALQDEPTDYADYMVCNRVGKLFKYDSNGKIQCIDPTSPAPDSPKVQPAPVVSTPPKVIYRDRIIERDVPGDTQYVPVYVPVPTVPPRRLAEADPFDTTTTATAPSKTIKVKYTLDSLSYGTLLHEPLSYEQRRIPIRIDDTFAEKFAEKQEIALNNFVRAAGGEITPASTEPIKNDINSVAVALIGRNYQDFNSTLTKVTPIISCEGIAAFVNYFINQNYLNFKPISTIPYSYTTYDPKPNIVYPTPDKAIQDLLEKLEISIRTSRSNGDSTEEDIDISELARRFGVSNFPITVPSTLIQETDNNNNPIAISSIQIQSLTELVVWFFQRWEEATGQWEIPIEIKDTDLVQAGDQSKTIKFPNQAEMLAEMFMLMFQANVNTETLINMCTRILFEGGQDKQQNFITYKLLYSLVDWAGYKTKDVTDEMPLLFNPNEKNLSDILKETKVRVGTQVLDEKFGLEIDLMRFRKAAGIIDAVHFRKINPFADIVPQIMSYLLGAKDTSDKLNPDEIAEEFEKFIEEAENGFSNTPGISSPDLPYGKPFSERPRIRDLTQDNSTNP